MLGGNPLCCLLVSSNATNKTFLEIYNKLQSIEKRSLKNSKTSMSYMLAIEMSIDYIKNESPGILTVLKHLCLCPSGLSDHNIKAICKDWDKWVGLLKDRSLITETKIFDDDFKLN
jgi:hypothetical protein